MQVVTPKFVYSRQMVESLLVSFREEGGKSCIEARKPDSIISQKIIDNRVYVFKGNDYDFLQKETL